jgi:energy-coupling factor transporter ATP-binding protein EcfA2
MKIIQLTAENIKRLKVIDITPKGNYVEITGKNGSGKTSVLDTIFWTLAGERNIQDIPLRRGAEKGFGRVDLGSIIVERRFTAKGTTSLKVTNAEGAMFPSPQAVLDDLFSRFTFDPLAFTKKKPREQYEELRAIAKVGIDIDALEAANKADYNNRTEANRRAKELTARADGGFKFEYEPQPSIDLSAAVKEVEEAARFNASIQEDARKRTQLLHEAQRLEIEATQKETSTPLQIEQNRKEKLEPEIARLHAAIERAKVQFDNDCELLNADMAKARAKADDCKRVLVELPPLQTTRDVALLRARIETAQRINREVDLRKDQEDLRELAKAAEAQAEKLTAAMEAREKTKREAMEKAEMPIPGISLGAGSVLFDGLPLEQASDAQQLCISTAIAMAANPKLRVIRIRDGSLLDDDLRDLLAKMAAEKDYQLWVERVDSTGKIGVVMEDGEVAGDFQPESKKVEA